MQYIIAHIDKLYTQIVKIFRLYLRIEPLAVMFSALGHCTRVRVYTETVDPACRPTIPQQWYWQGTDQDKRISSVGQTCSSSYFLRKRIKLQNVGFSKIQILLKLQKRISWLFAMSQIIEIKMTIF